MAILSKLILQLLLNDQASKGLKGVAGEAAKASKTMKEHFKDAGQSLAGAMAAAGTARSIKSQLLDPGISAAAQMQAALNRLSVNLSSSGVDDLQKKLEEARRTADQIQALTPFSSTQVLDEAITGLAKAGFGYGDIVGPRGGAAASAALAAAEGTSISAGNNAVVVLATKFGLAGEELFKAADLLVRAGGASNTDAISLADALSQTQGAQGLLSPEETLSLLGALANAGKGGSEGGTAVSSLLAVLPEIKKKTGGKINPYGADGKFVGLEAFTAQIRDAFEGASDKKAGRLKAAFGRDASPALEALLSRDAGKSLEAVAAGMMSSTSLDQRQAVMSSGLDAQINAFRGTASSTLARLFEPALSPLGDAAAKLNELAAALGETAAEDPRIAQAATYGAVGLTGAAALVAAAQLARAGRSGLAGLGALGKAGSSAASTAAGVAAGKAIQETTGTTAVFVTNWPATFSNPGSSLNDALKASGPPTKWSERLGKLGKASAIIGGVVEGGMVGKAIGDWINENPWTDSLKDLAVQHAAHIPAEFLGMVGGEKGGKIRDNARTAYADAEDRVAKLLNLTVNVARDGSVTAELDDGKTVEKILKAAKRNGTD